MSSNLLKKVLPLIEPSVVPVILQAKTLFEEKIPGLLAKIYSSGGIILTELLSEVGALKAILTQHIQVNELKLDSLKKEEEKKKAQKVIKLQKLLVELSDDFSEEFAVFKNVAGFGARLASFVGRRTMINLFGDKMDATVAG